MNCSQARALLAISRELKKGQPDTTALEDHLEECTECKQMFAQYQLIGEHLRSLPAIEPAPDAHTKLMQALAAEHARFIQHTPTAATPTPTFLIPYLKEFAPQTPQTDALAAFSTADTGPLPVIRPVSKRRRRRHMSQMAVLGVAAACLMVLMISGLTSMLLFANGAVNSNISNASVNRAAQVAADNYQAAAIYPHVASAVANREYIYYTAYSDDMQNWMLESFDNKTQISAPLLSNGNTSPLLVLAVSQDWLVWLQFDPSKATTGKRGLYETEHNLERTWSLHALYLGTSPAGTTASDTPITLYQDTFDPGVTPDWVHTPVQGVWLTQDSLLVTMIDAKGISHLWSYQLDATKAPVATEIAQAGANHSFSSPTATMDGKDIYWSEEWINGKNVLSSNIWTRQVVEATPAQPGRWAAHAVTEKYLFREDGVSFLPQIVQDKLFYLKASTSVTNDLQATPDTATPTAQATAVPTMAATGDVPAINAPDTTITGRTDPAIYTLALDESVQGTLVAFSANGALALPSPQQDRLLASAPQGGSRFLLWQTSAKTFEMYDVVTKAPVTVGANTMQGATFVAVNGDTTVWQTSSTPTDHQSGAVGQEVNFGSFSWPPTRVQ